MDKYTPLNSLLVYRDRFIIYFVLNSQSAMHCLQFGARMKKTNLVQIWSFVIAVNDFSKSFIKA